MIGTISTWRLKIAFLALLIVSTGTSLLAQANGGSISGKVVADDGMPLVNTTITASTALSERTTLSPSPLEPHPTVTGSVLARAATARDGTFRLGGLPAGRVVLCVAVKAPNLLDPCQWGPQAPAVSLATGQSISNFNITVRRGSVVRVRLKDPGGLLEKPRNGHPPSARVGISTSAGFLYPASVSRKEQDQYYEIGIPFDTPLSLTIVSPDLDVADAAGAVVPGNGKTLPIVHSRKRGIPPPLVFRVIRAKP